MRNSRRAALIVFGCCAAPAPAQPQPSQSGLIDALARCSLETSDARRLACYDPAVRALTEASRKGEVTVVSREEVRKTRRSLFGFALPSMPLFRGDDSADEVQEMVELSLSSARPAGNGAYVLSFEDGSVWQTTEPVRTTPRAGEKVTIKRATLGSYFLRVAGRSVRGKRIR